MGLAGTKCCARERLKGFSCKMLVKATSGLKRKHILAGDPHLNWARIRPFPTQSKSEGCARIRLKGASDKMLLLMTYKKEGQLFTT